MNQIAGGILIGIAVTLMLLFNGRVTGISGILGGILDRTFTDKYWRIMFLTGLLTGGILLKFILPESFTFQTSALPVDYLIAGLLVGFGTLMGNGCTSGHGVCGLSRLSQRSLIATVTFILSGVVSVLIFKWLRGYL